MSNVKRICAIFALAATAGLVMILAASNVHGFAGTAFQNIGTALFTAGLIAFPLAILGHSELTHAARSDLRQLRETSADKILEERLSPHHIETLREDTFGKPVIEDYRLHITLHEDPASHGAEPVITLVHDREYYATNRNAAVTLIDILHHTTGPLRRQETGRTSGFIYVRLEIDDGPDVLEWDSEATSSWAHSAEGRFTREWRGCTASLGREASMKNVFSFRAAGLQIAPGSTLSARIISETQVAATGAEPFAVYLPTINLEVAVTCGRDMNVALFPLYALQAGGLVPKSRFAARPDKMQEITWRWGKALFAGQGVILRWAKTGTESES